MYILIQEADISWCSNLLPHHPRLKTACLRTKIGNAQTFTWCKNDDLWLFLTKKKKSVSCLFKDALVSEIFLGQQESRKVAKTSSARKRKTSGYLGLQSHFHANARVRIRPSGSDLLIFLQTCISIWLVHLIGNTWRTRDYQVGIGPFCNLTAGIYMKRI